MARGPAHPGVTFEQWAEEGRMHVRRINHSSWALGDWLIVGMYWDADFVQAAAITGYSASHLFNVRRVAMAWPPHERSYAISFTTYLHLLRERDLPARRLLVVRALRERWTPEHAIAHFAGKRAASAPAPEGAPDAPAPVEAPVPRPRTRGHGRPGRPPSRKVKCPHCGEVFPLYGHEVPRGDPDA